MAVYVDDMDLSLGEKQISHMIADTREELLAMADRIGLPRERIQKLGTRWEHFDVSRPRRDAAIGFGAVKLTMSALAQKCADRERGKPAAH